MPRMARLDGPGVLHHVMARGIERRRLFREDVDRDDFLRRVAGLVGEKAWVVYAWALIPNHFHLLVRTAGLPLSRTMRRLMTGYAVSFNRRHRRSGHLFQNRFKSIVVEEEEYFLELVRYLHLNPLRAGQVQTLRDLDSYPYSGHSALMGKVDRPWQDTAEVLGRFAGGVNQARRKYWDHLEGAIDQGRRPDLMGGGLVRSAGGWDAVRELHRGREAFVSDERVLGSSGYVERLLGEAEREERDRTRARRSGVSFPTLVERISRDLSVHGDLLRTPTRVRAVSEARAALAHVWVNRLGRTGPDLARQLGLSVVAVYRAAARGARSGASWTRKVDVWCK